VEKTMMPIIGVTIWKELNDNNVYQKVNEANLNSISHNGGIPIMLPITNNEAIIDKYLEMVDGIFFTGGEDINPLIFGEEPINGLGNIEYDRDDFEVKLYKKAAKINMPMLGICRGMQLMNVAEGGGTVYQDIYSQRPSTNNHSPKFTFGCNEYHSILIEENSKIYQIFKTKEIKTNSYHHQAVRDIADGYKATAFAKDGIVECIESENLNFAIGVQWHPEVMYNKFPLFNNLFKAFIDESSRYKQKGI
jgi:putative glutamine amidotransferase